MKGGIVFCPDCFDRDRTKMNSMTLQLSKKDGIISLDATCSMCDSSFTAILKRTGLVDRLFEALSLLPEFSNLTLDRQGEIISTVKKIILDKLINL